MSYQTNIPQPGDRISKSQADILGNFSALAPFGNGYCDLPEQSPAPTLPGNDQGIYGFVNATTGVNETYFHKQTVDAPSEVPGTACSMSYTAMASCVNGWGYLPNGLLMKWGTSLAPNNTNFNVNVASLSGGPVYNQIFTTYLTPVWNSATPTNTASVPFLTESAVTTAGNFSMFVSNFDSVNSSFSYLVIGV